VVAFGEEEAVLPVDNNQHPCKAEVEKLFAHFYPGNSKARVQLRRNCCRACLNPFVENVLFLGPVGAGKTMLANVIAFGIKVGRMITIEAKSEVEKACQDGCLDRANRFSLEGEGCNSLNGGGFKSVLATGLSAELAASQLFGHKKGAFTGAENDKQGVFVAVAKDGGDFTTLTGGIVFIDEVADLDLAVQGKLLNVINGGPFRPVGGEEDDPSYFSGVTIWATNNDIKLRDKNCFRSDLLSRICAVAIEMPPLTEQLEDLDEIVMRIDEKTRKDLLKRRQDVGVSLRKTLSSRSPSGGTIESRESRKKTLEYWNAEDEIAPRIADDELAFLKSCNVAHLGELRGLTSLIQLMYSDGISVEAAFTKMAEFSASSESVTDLFQRVLAAAVPGQKVNDIIKKLTKEEKLIFKEMAEGSQPLADRLGIQLSNLNIQVRNVTPRQQRSAASDLENEREMETVS